ncbi:hypothetical protein [Thiobacter aerophilum]|uniref:Uncharacterized protein n=1 Tax=Thiobacter aerophilum TaxID=3121275 RepID=A0ABV0EFE1_9BURK
MAETPTRWGKTLFWGLLVALLYWGLFHYQDAIVRLAHTTTQSCLVVEDGKEVYYHKPTAEACAAKGGILIEGNRLNVLVPIVVAFVMSYAHGAFTGMFWDSLGLKAAKKK